MATLPPNISYYAAAAKEALRLHRLHIEEMHAATDILTRRRRSLKLFYVHANGSKRRCNP